MNCYEKMSRNLSGKENKELKSFHSEGTVKTKSFYSTGAQGNSGCQNTVLLTEGGSVKRHRPYEPCSQVHS